MKYPEFVSPVNLDAAVRLLRDLNAGQQADHSSKHTSPPTRATRRYPWLAVFVHAAWRTQPGRADQQSIQLETY